MRENQDVARFRAGLFMMLLLSALIPAAHADEWPTPVIREVFSPSRAYFVRITPGTSWGDVEGFKSAPKGPYAEAEFYHRENDRSYRLTGTISTVNPVAPVEFLVTDSGFLVTLDNWHNRGYGKVVAVYSAEGKLVRADELRDIFTAAEIEKFERSVSSIAWRKPVGAYIRPGGRTVNVQMNNPGTSFILELGGAYQYCETRAGSFQCRTTNQGRTWHGFREPDSGQP